MGTRVATQHSPRRQSRARNKFITTIALVAGSCLRVSVFNPPPTAARRFLLQWMSLSEHGEKTERSGIGLKSTLLRYTSAKLLRSEWSLVLLVTAVGFGLRWWWPLTRADLWYDEMYSYIIARQPFPEM